MYLFLKNALGEGLCVEKYILEPHDLSITQSPFKAIGIFVRKPELFASLPFRSAYSSISGRKTLDNIYGYRRTSKFEVRAEYEALEGPLKSGTTENDSD